MLETGRGWCYNRIMKMMDVKTNDFLKDYTKDEIDFLIVRKSNSLPLRTPKKFITLDNTGVRMIETYAKKISECSYKSITTLFSLKKESLVYSYLGLYYDNQRGVYFYAMKNRELEFEEDTPEEYDKKLRLSESDVGIFDGRAYERNNEDVVNGEGLWDYLYNDYRKNEYKMKQKAIRKANSDDRKKTKKMKLISEICGKYEKENWRGIVL